jgi:signal transduction histidine kinase
MGGLYLKKGDLPRAHEYLTKCLALYAKTDTNGNKITPYIKLAELYVKLGDTVNAAENFQQSRLLLNHFYKQNPQSLINWNKLYADYLFKINDPKKAYHYKEAYIRLKDSVSNDLSELYRLDVVRELDVIQQKQALSEFKQRDKLRMVYLAGIIIFVLLFIIIIILIYRNLKKTKQNHAIAKLQNEQMQQTVAELERVNKNYIRIMRVMAHDLRNPLSGMTGLAAVLMEGDDFSDENKQMLRLIETTGIHSMEMINELLKTGLANEEEKLVKEKLDLRSLLYDSVELLQFKAADKQQQIIFESDNTPVTAEVNHEKIWRVINNLIVNAIKFSHVNGIIKVGIKHNNAGILISVADNGIGIPLEQKDSVFEMFTPAKKVGTDGEQPFGLGLSISKKIIEMHHGNIWFESSTERGTTFYIELPYK